MNQLITGGAGFIGANYLYYLTEAAEKNAEDRIVCLDSLTYAGNLHTIDELIAAGRITFVKGDVTDKDLVAGILDEHRIDAIVHFAAESHVDRSIEDASAFLNTNIIGTHVLLEAGRRHGVSRFHQVSTDEVYGDLPLDRPDLLFTEETPIRTSSPYSASKASADLLALAYFRTFRFPVTISRCSNNYGPYQFPEKLIPLMIANALADKKLPVYGKGENIRDWLHVRDHCRAIEMIVRNGRPGEVYNVGGHNERSNLQIVRTILKHLNKEESLIEYVTDRKGHDLRYAIDASKIERELGWKPEIFFDEGIVSTIEWYMANRPWWEEIVSGEYQSYYRKMYGGR
jgi:dTDP-glucose 4,6-dehydratase